MHAIRRQTYDMIGVNKIQNVHFNAHIDFVFLFVSRVCLFLRQIYNKVKFKESNNVYGDNQIKYHFVLGSFHLFENVNLLLHLILLLKIIHIVYYIQPSVVFKLLNN